MVYVLSNTPLFRQYMGWILICIKNVIIHYKNHNKMADKYCFTPVKITPPAPPAPNAAAGGAAPAYTIKSLPNDVDVVNIGDYTFVEYSFDPALDTAAAEAAEANIADAAAADQAASVRRINFFKFGADGTNPRYIKTHDAGYDANALPVDIVIDPNDKKYLIIRKDGDQILGGSKSARKSRKMAKKSRKSARKSRSARGSRSKK